MTENTKNVFRAYKPCFYMPKGSYDLPKTAEIETFENMENSWIFDLGWGNYDINNQAVFLKKNAWYMPHGGVRLVAQREDWNIIHENKYLKVRFTSGCLTSKKKFHFGQYYFDAQFPIEIGCWSALWLWGQDGDKWYEEIDWEQFNKNNFKKNKISVGTYKGQSHATSIHNNSVIKCVCSYRRRKIYMIDWQKDSVSFYINGMLVARITDNVPQHPLNVVLSLGLGWFDKMKDWSEFNVGEIVGQLRIYKFVYIPNSK